MAQGPLRVKYDIPPEFLVKKVLLEGNSGMQVSNIQYTGHEKALGGFSNNSKYYLIKKGIILSTGFCEDAIGPNQYEGMGTALDLAGLRELDGLANGKTYDGASLSFDFIAEFDTIQFKFMFASEEYPEYVDKGVNDVFAFFIEDLESGKKENLAVLKDDGSSINIDNVNSNKNASSYIENGKWDPNNVGQWAADPGLGELALTYEFDGFTNLLSAGSAVVPGKKYRISFCIADVGDKVYDSAVFLEAGSFMSFPSKPTASFKTLQVEFQNEFSETSAYIEMKQEALMLSVLINFEFDAFTTDEDSSLLILNKISRLLKLHADLHLDIMGHTDNVGSEEYNLNLSQKRADFASDYLIETGVLNNRIETSGYGDSKPVSNNVTAKGRLKNRRIEFLFHRL